MHFKNVLVYHLSDIFRCYNSLAPGPLSVYPCVEYYRNNYLENNFTITKAPLRSTSIEELHKPFGIPMSKMSIQINAVLGKRSKEELTCSILSLEKASKAEENASEVPQSGLFFVANGGTPGVVEAKGSPSDMEPFI